MEGGNADGRMQDEMRDRIGMCSDITSGRLKALTIRDVSETKLNGSGGDRVGLCPKLQELVCRASIRSSKIVVDFLLSRRGGAHHDIGAVTASPPKSSTEARHSQLLYCELVMSRDSASVLNDPEVRSFIRDGLFLKITRDVQTIQSVSMTFLHVRPVLIVGSIKQSVY